jgi:hypothetical protein
MYVAILPHTKENKVRALYRNGYTSITIRYVLEMSTRNISWGVKAAGA